MSPFSAHSISSNLHIEERLAFYAELESLGLFPPSWLAYVRDVIPAGNPEFDSLVLAEPLNMFSKVIAPEDTTRRFNSELEPALDNIFPSLLQKTQPLTGLDRYSHPVASLIVHTESPASPSPIRHTPPAKKQKKDSLKIHLKF